MQPYIEVAQVVSAELSPGDDVLTFTDGNNLKLAGNFVTTADDTITLAYDGRFYKADLPANLFENDKTRFYLAFESEQKGADLFARLSRTGKIASMDEMPRLLSAALFGLKIDLLPVPPEELPQKSPNTTYFLVDTTHPFWQMIKNGRNIAVFSDLPSDSTVIKLFPVATQD